MARFNKSITEGNTNYNMYVTVKLQKTDHEYFSITYEQITRGRVEACGAGHDTIRKYFGNQFDDVIPFHLAHSDGVPSHALENGYYFLQNPEEFSSEVVANHFRVSLSFVEVLKALSKEGLSQWVEQQKPRWKSEADAMRAKYEI